MDEEEEEEESRGRALGREKASKLKIKLCKGSFLLNEVTTEFVSLGDASTLLATASTTN